MTLLFLCLFIALNAGPVSVAADADRFKYGTTAGNDYGPADWDQVSCGNYETCPGWPTKFADMSPWISYDTNTCKDCSRSTTGNCAGHRQSPIALYKNVTKIRQCIDIHKMGFTKGQCALNQLDFRILPHVLRVYWPRSCPVTPQIDFSRHSPDPWNMRFMDITIPSHHTIDGRRYAAEITLSHTYSVQKTDRRLFIGNMNVLISIGGSSSHNDFMELFLGRFEAQAARVRAACSARRALETVDDLLEARNHSLRGSQSGGTAPGLEVEHNSSAIAEEERRLAYTGEFHPYVWHLQTGSQYYFRYRGSWVEPPCLEDLTAEWRVMKEPVAISPDQFDRLDRLLSLRLDPTTCQRDTAGKPRAGSSNGRRDYNRPTQTTTDMHELTYCECVDFSSGYPKDQGYCAKSMSERGVFPYQG